jgi:triosephosphate isomerase (TIM)
MQYLIVNFKSHKTQSEIESWREFVLPHLQAFKLHNPGIVVTIAPPTPYLHLLPKEHLAAQTVSPYPAGSYTGATNARQLKDHGVKYCLVGHSERREHFHETASEVSRQVTELLKEEITPIVCLRENDISPQLNALDPEILPKLILAYEPSGDIGGSETAPVAHIQEVTERIIKACLKAPLAILYGGSVNAQNLHTLPSDLGGVIVSTASLDPASFVDVLTQVSGHA